MRAHGKLRSFLTAGALIGASVVVPTYRAGADPTATTATGAAAVAASHEYALLQSAVFGSNLLADMSDGSLVPVGDAVLASRDGRYVVGPDGTWTDRQTSATYRPDVAALVPGTTTVTPLQVAAVLGTVYLLRAEPAVGPSTLVVVDAASRSASTYADVSSGSISPNGRYLGVGRAIIDRELGRTVTSVSDGSVLLAPKDDGRLVHDRDGRQTVERFDGTVVFEPKPVNSFTALGQSDDFRIGIVLLDSAFDYLFDAQSGATFGINSLIGYGNPSYATGRLSADGDTLLTAIVPCSGGCGPTLPVVRIRHGIRALLAPVVPTVGRLAAGETAVIALGPDGQPAPPLGSAVLNLTVTAPANDGFLTVWPCSDPMPPTSGLAYRAGQTVAGATIVSIDAKGMVCVYTHAATDLVVDVFDLSPLGGGTAPVRVLDTRDGGVVPDGVIHVPLQPHDQFSSFGTFTVTGVEPADDTFATVFACDQPRPAISNLNVAAGRIAANVAFAATGVSDTSGPEICVYVNRPMHVVVDQLDTRGTAAFRNLGDDAIRLFDSRTADAGDHRRLPAGSVSVVSVIQADGTAVNPRNSVFLNVTAVDPAAEGYVTVYPCGTELPTTSNLNHGVGEDIANLAYTTVGADGTVCVFNQQPTDIVVDLLAANRPLSFTPRRVLDTRLAHSA